MRFCMITTFYPPYSFGGDAIFVYRLANMLARRGHSVHVIHCLDSYRALTKAPPASDYPHEPGVTLHGLVSGVGGLSPFATYQTGYPVFKGRKIRRILDSQPFDVIHFHNISLIGGPMILRYGQAIKLYSMHEHWLICPTHVLFKFQREACVSPSCLRCTLVYRRPPQLWRYTGMLKAAVRHVDAFIAPSTFTLRRHHQDGLDIPIVHIPHGLDNSWAESAPSLLPDSIQLPPQPFFLFVGRLEKLKGLQTAIPVFRDLPDAHLVIVGDGSYATQLKQLAAGCDRIHFLGPVELSQLKGVFERSLALLVPSITFETFGQVVIEAYANRVPVIARDLGPFPELIRHSGGGLLFRDDASLLAALERLQADPGLRNRLGEAGYAAYRSQWTEEVYMGNYLGLIEEIQTQKRLG